MERPRKGEWVDEVRRVGPLFGMSISMFESFLLHVIFFFKETMKKYKTVCELNICEELPREGHRPFNTASSITNLLKCKYPFWDGNSSEMFQPSFLC